MPKNKDFKRLVRSRMEKTGEAYTTSRSHLLGKRGKAGEGPGTGLPAASGTVDTSLAGMSDRAVAARTGRDWAGWVETLDARGAASRAHREIAAELRERDGLPSWWAQTVTVGYERIRGLREVGQRRDGGYEITKSRTLPVPLGRLYRAFADPRLRARWLPGVRLTVRKATAGRALRITWEDGTDVDAGFFARGEGRSQVQVQHSKLANREDAEAKKAYWGERLDALSELLGASEPPR